MSFTPPTPPPFSNPSSARQLSQPRWKVRRYSRPQSVPAQSKLTRRFEFEWLEDGQILSGSRVAPALPVFEQAFGAFSHGVLVQTSDGPVAVEDLEPGMQLETTDGEKETLLWKGAIMIVPGAPSLSDLPDKLFRVMPDAFGLGRPAQDQTFGPHVRMLNRDPKVRAALGSPTALMPMSGAVDGVSVIEVTPVAPTRVYHLACETHRTILAAGMEVETYHPGPDAALSLSEEMMRHFMQFFPYLGSIADFGRLVAPRVSTDDVELLG
ncbi:MAG: Hint domain-containing protein [Pseudomonadota bacterium]